MGVNRHRNRGAAASAQGAAAISDRPDLELSEDDIVPRFAPVTRSAANDTLAYAVAEEPRFIQSPPEVA